MRTFYRVTIITACVLIIFGGVIALVALANGGTLIRNYLSDYTPADFQEEYENVTEINFDIAAADVDIVTEKGTKFKIEATNIPQEIFYSKVKDGKWTIGYDKKHMGWIRIFDWGYSDFKTTIKITLPEDHSFDSAIIDGGAADIDIEYINAKKLKLDIGAGDLKVNKLYTNNLDIDTGVGETVINGEVVGDIKIDCGVGNVEITLSNKQNDFNYDIDLGVGSVTIGNTNYAGADEKRINNNADYDIKIDCGVGNVSIKFKEE